EELERFDAGQRLAALLPRPRDPRTRGGGWEDWPADLACLGRSPYQREILLVHRPHREHLAESHPDRSGPGEEDHARGFVVQAMRRTTLAGIGRGTDAGGLAGDDLLARREHVALGSSPSP